MDIQDLLDKQRELCRRMSPSYAEGTYSPFSAVRHEQHPRLEQMKTEETKVLVMALHCELTELMDALNWKPWRKSKKDLDFNNIEEEICDMWHFLMELSLLWNVNPEKGLLKTFQKNEDRIKGGY